jgi:hypothetical protein
MAGALGHRVEPGGTQHAPNNANKGTASPKFNRMGDVPLFAKADI